MTKDVPLVTICNPLPREAPGTPQRAVLLAQRARFAVIQAEDACSPVRGAVARLSSSRAKSRDPGRPGGVGILVLGSATAATPPRRMTLGGGIALRGMPRGGVIALRSRQHGVA